MLLTVTGGGTGGHVYPALEVARLARDRGAELTYLGSLRGQESAACAREGISFQGFPSEPVYSMRTPRGWRVLLLLLRATRMAKRALKEIGPDVVFSTGGYSAAPVMGAARSLGIPYVIHEANSVPGRSNLMFARRASAFTCAFRSTERFTKGIPVIRTGQPIRRELREAAAAMTREPGSLVVVLGGSGGSLFLNQTVPPASEILDRPDVHWLHSSGRDLHEKALAAAQLAGTGDNYVIQPYLETGELLEAYKKAAVAIARSGGTLAEIALFRIPSVLVPLPASAGDHQLYNAIEFSDMNAATLLRQEITTPAAIAEAVEGWLDDPGRVEVAQKSLAEWDVPDATERICDLIAKAGGKA